jgi:hypothetical protein
MTQQKIQTMDKGTNTNSINMEKTNFVINEVVSVEELPNVKIVDKSTTTKGLKDLKMEVMHKSEDGFN